jgi:hypothetical protein
MRANGIVDGAVPGVLDERGGRGVGVALLEMPRESANLMADVISVVQSAPPGIELRNADTCI